MTCDVRNCTLLRNVLFAGLPSDAVARLGCAFHLAHYRKNHIIYAEGGSVYQVFALRSGLVKLSKLIDNGKERIVRIVFPGELFGLEALNDTSYGLTAVALGDSEVCATTPDEFFDFLRQDPEIALGLVRTLVTEVGRTRSQLTEMSFKDARMKVATFLLSVAPPHRVQPLKGFSTKLPFSRQEISEILELSSETVSRIVSKFKREHLIEVRGRHLTIRDRAGLKEAAQR